MPKLEYFLIAESFAIDQQTNRVSIFNVLEQVNLVEATNTGPRINTYAAIGYWLQEPTDVVGTEYLAGLKLYINGNLSATLGNFSFTFSPNGRARVLFYIQGPPIFQAGDLRFELLLNDIHAADHVLSLIHI